jgi:hypothetical protein
MLEGVLAHFSSMTTFDHKCCPKSRWQNPRDGMQSYPADIPKLLAMFKKRLTRTRGNTSERRRALKPPLLFMVSVFYRTGLNYSGLKCYKFLIYIKGILLKPSPQDGHKK